MTETKCRITVLGLLLLLCGAAAVVNAQQASSMHPTLSLPEDYRFSAITRPNPSYGTHQSVTGIHYGPLVAFNDNNEAAFLAEFYDPHAGPVRGIFTSSGRAISAEGQRIGDITVLQIRTADPFDLQINRLNQVAWIGLIQAHECGRADTCLALFVGERLVAVAFGRDPNAYALADNGKITAPAGHSWFTPAAGARATVAGNEKTPSAGAAVAVGIARHLPSIRLPWVTIPTGTKTGPVIVDPGTVQPGGIATEIAQGMGTGQPGQPVPQKTAPFEPMVQLPYCAAPQRGGWPEDWSRNANAAGPIASQRQEWANYQSLYHPNVHRWMKKTSFSADCREIFVAAMESPGVTQELWSPAGMIASFDAGDSVYRMNGIPPVALPSANIPIEDGIRINRHCAVLAVVSFKHAIEDEAALVVGVPTKGGHCPTE